MRRSPEIFPGSDCSSPKSGRNVRVHFRLARTEIAAEDSSPGRRFRCGIMPEKLARKMCGLPPTEAMFEATRGEADTERSEGMLRAAKKVSGSSREAPAKSFSRAARWTEPGE